MADVAFGFIYVFTPNMINYIFIVFLLKIYIDCRLKHLFHKEALISKTMPSAISVIMPIFNQAEFICRAINSLIDQSFTNWELVIIDDGSKDKIYDI